MLWLYFMVPILAGIATLVVAKFSNNKEANKQYMLFTAILMVGSCLLQTSAYIGFISAGQSDTEVLNGQVISKSRERVSCEHSYECMCYYTESCSGSGSNRSCTRTRHCSTCYEHSHDVDWDVHTSVGDLSIDRIDRQGLKEPPRWSQVKLGEPAAREHHYLNYVKGNKDSLFSKDKKYAESFKDQIPPYPEVYDYYRFSRVLNITGRALPIDYWNDYLNNTLKTLGTEKQVNIIWVVTSGKPVEFFNGLVYEWAGGKKNDVIVVTDIDENNNINWMMSTSFADGMDNAQLHARNSSSFTSKGFGVAVLSDVAGNISKEFTRVPMEKMEYLKYRTLHTWEMVLMFVLGLLPLGVFHGISWYSAYQDKKYRRRY